MSKHKHTEHNNKRAEGKPTCGECCYFSPKTATCVIRFALKDASGNTLPPDDCTPMPRGPHFVQCSKFEALDLIPSNIGDNSEDQR